MYYALEACSLRVSQFKSINYVINSTKSQEVVDDCLKMFVRQLKRLLLYASVNF